VKNATANALFATRMYDQKPWCAYVMNVTSAPTAVGVLYVVLLESPTRITAPNVLDWRKTAMAVPRLSIWELVEQICSMSGVVWGSKRARHVVAIDVFPTIILARSNELNIGHNAPAFSANEHLQSLLSLEHPNKIAICMVLQ